MLKPRAVRYEREGPAVKRRYVGRLSSRGPWQWTTSGAVHFGYRDERQVDTALPYHFVRNAAYGSAYGWEGEKFVISVRAAF